MSVPNRWIAMLAGLCIPAAGCSLAPSTDKAADASLPTDPNGTGSLTLQGTVYNVQFGPGPADSSAVPAAGATVEVRLVGIIGPDTIPSDTIPTDSLPFPPDSLPFPPDSNVLDSFPPPPDTLLTGDRPFPGDTIPGDSIPVDSMPGDTIVIPPDSMPGWTCGTRGTLVAAVQTDANGHYAVTGLNAGIYDVQARASSGSPGRVCGVPLTGDAALDLYIQQ